jgi:hypothetical protein
MTLASSSDCILFNKKVSLPPSVRTYRLHSVCILTQTVIAVVNAMQLIDCSLQHNCGMVVHPVRAPIHYTELIYQSTTGDSSGSVSAVNNVLLYAAQHNCVVRYSKQ